MCLDRAPEPARAAGQLGVDTGLLEGSIAAIHIEDLMVLFMDGVGGLRTEFYAGGSGGRERPVQRRGYGLEWLAGARVRQMLRAEFERRIHRLIARAGWRTLHWLHFEFPARELCASRAQEGWDSSAAVAAVDELRRLLKQVARSTLVEGHAAWDLIVALDDEPGIRREAVSAIRDGLRNATDEQLLYMCYPDAFEIIGGGLGSTANDVYDAQWASMVVDYLRVLNNLRQGEAAETGVGYSDGSTSVFGGRAIVVGRATSLWNSLSAPQRALLADQDQWRLVVTAVWPEVRARIDWGMAEGGSDNHSATYRGGLYREPIGHRDLLTQSQP